MKKLQQQLHWRRLVANSLLIFGGLLIGVIGSFFAYTCNEAEAIFNHIIQHATYYSLVITPIGFVALFYLSQKIFPGTAGSGIPEAIAAFDHNNDAIRRSLLAPKVLLGKFILTLGGFLCGASIGREGPTVLIASGILYALTWLPIRLFKFDYVRRGLITAGGAAGIAAAFFTPLGGLVFAIEEHGKSFQARMTKTLMITILLSGFVCAFYLHSRQFFSVSTGDLSRASDWLIIPVCGMLGGVLGALFSKLLFKILLWLKQFSFKHRMAIAFLLGLFVAIIGIISNGETFGSSYTQSNQLIIGGDIVFYFGLLKLLATLATAVSGICGGILAPTLATGAGIGAMICQWFPHVSQSAIVILAMASYFNGVVRSPMTCFVIVLEMTGRHDLIIPLMAATVIAEVTASLFNKTPIYTALAKEVRPHA